MTTVLVCERCPRHQALTSTYHIVHHGPSDGGKVLDNFNVLGIEELGPRQALIETLIVKVDAANVLVFLLGNHGWVDCGTEGRARAGADCLGHKG